MTAREILGRSEASAPSAKPRLQLDDFDRSVSWVGRACKLLGISTTLPWGRRVPCPLPGHEGAASLWEDKKKRFVVHCWCEDRFYPLVSVYVAQQLGSVEALDAIRGPELARWKLRLLLELGDLPDPLEGIPLYSPLPDDTPQHVREFWDGFFLALRVRWIEELGKPVPFSLRFAARWCCNRITKHEAEDARGWLFKNRYLLKEGKVDRTTLWLPGPGPKDKV